MADNIDVRIGAQIGDLRAGMQQAAQSVQSAVQMMQQAFSGLAIEETIRRAIDATVKFATESELLGRTLGVTSQEASILKDALEVIGLTGDTYSTAFVHFTRQLRMHESAINDLGVATRNNLTGETLKATDVMNDALNAVKQYAPGIDQARAAQFYFGRSIDDVMKLQRLNKDIVAEATIGLEAWGLVVGGKDVEAAHRYQSATAQMHNALQGMQKIIATALLPIFETFTADLEKSSTTVIPAVTVSVSMLAAGFIGLKMSAEIVWYTFKAVVEVIATAVASLINQANIAVDTAGAMLAKAKGFDWKGVGAAASEGWQKMKAEGANAVDQMGQKWDENNAKIVESADKNMAHLKALWGNTMQALGVESSKISAPKADTGAGGGNKSFIDPVEERRIQEIRLQGEHDTAIAAIDMQREKFKTLRTIGDISAQQEIIATEMLDKQKFDIDSDYLSKLRDLHKNDKVQLAKDDEAELKLKATRSKQLLVDEDALLIERRKGWTQFNKDAESGFSTLITDIVARGSTLKEALTSIWKSVYTSFVENMVSKPIAEYAMGLIKQTALYKAFQGTMLATQASGSTASIAIKGTEATAVVGANATEAASGAAASQAMIPIIGPALAIAAALAMLAFVHSMRSAAGGFDVPGGMNPMTQLHQKEMVLPADLADKIRGMTESGSGSGINVTINTTYADASGIKKMLMDHGPAISDSLKNQARNFRG